MSCEPQESSLARYLRLTPAMKQKRINAAFTEDQEEAIAQAVRDEAARIRRQAYYRVNRDRILAQSNQWRLDRKTSVPKKYAHMSLEEYNALDRVRRSQYKRKRVADMTGAEADAYREKKAEEARLRRQEKGDEVRAYQREYHRHWRLKNLDKVKEFHKRYNVKKKINKAIEANEATKKTKAKTDPKAATNKKK